MTGILQQNLFVLGKTKVRGWQAWLTIGIYTILAFGIIYLANLVANPEEIFLDIPPVTGSLLNLS